MPYIPYFGVLSQGSAIVWIYVGEQYSDPGADLNISGEFWGTNKYNDARDALEAAYPAASNLGADGAVFNELEDVYYIYNN